MYLLIGVVLFGDKIHGDRVSLKMVTSFIQDGNLCFYCKKMVWRYAGSLEQESMTSSMKWEFTTVELF